MKRIKPSNNQVEWPRKAVSSIETRKRDLVIRISDWTRDRDEPGYDVECYIGGVYDWKQSEFFSTVNAGKTKKDAKLQAIEFASGKIKELL